jgi:hypothetical protein
MRELEDYGASSEISSAGSLQDWGDGWPVSTPTSIGFEDIAGPRLIERTPHMDVNPGPPFRPGGSFDVAVYVSKHRARPADEVENVIAPAGARIEVYLIVTEHFQVRGKLTAFIDLDEERERCAARPFHVSVKRKIVSDRTPIIAARFFYQGRPCGKIARAIEIANVVAQFHPKAAVVAGNDTVSIELDAEPPDLCITVEAPNAAERQHFKCRVQTPLLDGKHQKGIIRRWSLPDSADKFMRQCMESFTADKSSRQIIDELRGVGRRLFRSSPKHFQDALWKLIEERKPPKTIAILSQEPFIPWELMIPHRRKKNGSEQVLPPLGVQFRVGRWISRDGISARQKISLSNSFVIAPRYHDDKALEFAEAEAKFVLSFLKGEQIEPARYERISNRLSEGRTLIHFVCHGKDDDNSIQLDLENNEQLTPDQLEGMDDVRSAFTDKKPLVFLNACDAGQSTRALVGLGGFPNSFIDMGASAVIAPLWSVKDSIAHEIAKEFYDCLKMQPPLPFSEIMCRIRERAYKPGAADSYAAYIFYGDPSAVCSISR